MEHGIKPFQRSRAELEASREAFLRLVGAPRELETADAPLQKRFTSTLADVRLYGGHVARHYELTVKALPTVRVQVNEGDDEDILRGVVADLLEDLGPADEDVPLPDAGGAGGPGSGFPVTGYE